MEAEYIIIFCKGEPVEDEKGDLVDFTITDTDSTLIIESEDALESYGPLDQWELTSKGYEMVMALELCEGETPEQAYLDFNPQ